MNLFLNVVSTWLKQPLGSEGAYLSKRIIPEASRRINDEAQANHRKLESTFFSFMEGRALIQRVLECAKPETEG
jgi:hypothetical protein